MTLDKNTTGAWLLHHDQKLQNAKTTEFESIVAAGRSARLLSVISKEEDSTVANERVVELARSIGVRRTEVDGLLNELVSQGLIDRSSTGVAVLGVTQARLLDYAADIFESQSPLGLDRGVIALAELGSHSPVRRVDCAEELSDTFKLSSEALEDLFSQSEQIGFLDYEKDGKDRLYFNGSLFKRETAAKSKIILDSLTLDERQKLLDVEGRMSQRGCLLKEEIRTLLGDQLWSKLHQIGYFEVSIVSNERGQTEFVSKAEALAKYIPNGLADMLDDAKALASSLTYGIVKSSKERGKIRDPLVLIDVLINRGFVEGWASALVQDYQMLERRGVVKVSSSSHGHRLTLLKPEIGRMAKDLVLRGNASATAAEIVIGDRATSFLGPEGARSVERRKEIKETKQSISHSLNILRKG